MERNTKSRLDSHPGATSSLFTDDLILEILSRLPARSVHRFNGHRHNFASVLGGAAPFHPSLPYLQPNKDEGIAQVDACNGLLLYRRYKKNMVTPWTEGDFIVVCNPATGWWVELPPQPQPPAPANIHSPTAGLAFDPVVSSHFHVLTFEETNLETYLTGVNIYSSRTRAWSRRDSGMVEKATLLRSKCVFVGGMLYLMGNLEDMNGEYVLVGVDMEGKVWKTIRVPYGSKFGTIGSSQGCLHYAVASVDDNNETLVSEISLWCLKDNDSKGLVLKHTTSIDKLMSMTGKTYRVVEIHPDCHTIFLVSNDGDTLAAYDMRHQKIGYILNLENNTQQFLPYVPMFPEPLPKKAFAPLYI
uniref:F-box protein At3g26010-like beta-propeller domain-containing protein n=1 Tax=Aegilops tauschii TaxID=37682 RepID=M8C1L1_AEGTA